MFYKQYKYTDSHTSTKTLVMGRMIQMETESPPLALLYCLAVTQTRMISMTTNNANVTLNLLSLKLVLHKKFIKLQRRNVIICAKHI